MKTTIKPWGHEALVFKSGYFSFKILNIKKGHRLSLQLHEMASENWMVRKGNPLIQLHEDCQRYSVGSSFSIGDGVPHRVTADKDNVVIWEMKYGSDKDITRLEDDYGRK